MDVPKYFTACTCLLNYLVRPQGGVTRRPGTKYVAETKQSAFKSRLIPMSVSATKHYVIEAGCEYMRFYSSNARLVVGDTPVEVTTPYAEADLFQIHRVPSVDIIYFLHRAYQTRKLERYSDTCFRFRTVTFKPPATREFGARPIARLKPSATSGDGITLHTVDGQAAFFDADCGRDVVLISGCNAGARAGIKAFTCAGSVVANVCSPFVNTNTNDCGTWIITGTPQAGVTPSDKSPVGKTVSLTLTIPGFRGATALGDSDCGRFASIHSGLYEIIKVSSCTVATAVIRGEASASTIADVGSWSLEEALWSSTNGWPETGGFEDGRLYLGSCHRFSGSKVNQYENHATGNLDDDAVSFAIDSDVLQQIRWIAGLEGLVIGTMAGEYQALGGNDSPITASNISVQRKTGYGSSTVAPLVVANAILFVTRSGRKLRELVQNPDTLDGYVAPDLLLLARHLTERSMPTGTDPTIVDLAYQQEPDSRLWAVRSDGVLLSCTYLRDQNVVAWSRHITEGSFESVCVIPHPDGDRDQVWVIVKRTINGQTKRYVEYFDDAGVNYDSTYVDCAYTCDRLSATCTIAGVSHLECARVQVVGDGGVFPDTTVIGGNVTVDAAIDKVEVGLPYDSVLTTMRPEISTREGTTFHVKMSWRKLVVRVLNSIGLIAGTEKSEQIIPWRSTCDLMDCAPGLFTGNKYLPKLGWDCAKVTVKQNLPLPSTILSIAGTIEVGSDG